MGSLGARQLLERAGNPGFVAKQPGLLPDATPEFRATGVEPEGGSSSRMLLWTPGRSLSRAAGTGISATVDLPLASKADVNSNDIDSPQDDRLSGVQGDPSSFSLDVNLAKTSSKHTDA